MKCLFFSLFLFAAVSASAQVTNTDRVFVLFSVAPAPTNLPAQAYYVTDVAVNPTGSWSSFWSTNWDVYLQTNQAGWQSWFTNPANPFYQTVTNRNGNLAAVVTAYSNVTFAAQGNWAGITNLANAKFAIQAEGDLLLKLKPILQQIYQGQ